MNREEAIDFLECRRGYYASLSTDPSPDVKATKVCGYTLAESANACSMAIKALKQEYCKDTISRKAVLDALDKSKYSNEFCENHHIDWSINLGMAHIVVNELKPVTPQPKTGYISIDDVMSVFDDFMCGDVDEDGTDTFLEMLKDKAESSET